MLLPRVLTGAALIGGIYLLVFFGTPLHFFLLVAVVILLSLREFHALLLPLAPGSLKILMSLLAVVLSTLLYLGREGGVVGLVALGTLGVLVLAVGRSLFNGSSGEQILQQVGLSLVGMLYVGFLLSHLVMIRNGPGGRDLVFLVFLLTWSQDVGAYFGGRWLGRHKLCPHLSPGKTVEGFFFGLGLCLVVAAATGGVWARELSLWGRMLLGLGVGLVGPMGDLFESMLKRVAGAKDSGAIFPGHGGFLDRLDSLIFVAPFAHYYLLFAAKGGI